jgi:diguanylate cyclase (GGDEF)-like protein
MLSSIDRRNDADKIYRWGGEEFVVLPRLMSMDEAKALAERIRTKVKETKVRVNDQDIKVTCSIGLLDVGAMISSSGSMRGAGLPDDIFDRCTTLLRASKEGGRNRVTVL